MTPSHHNPTRKAQRSILLTGATGLVGGFLLARLVQHTDWEIHALVRPKPPLSPEQRLTQVAQYFGTAAMLDRVRLHEGDLTAPDLGLPPHERHALRDRLTDVVHAAADVSFSGTTQAQTQQTNVQGTQHLLEHLVAPQTRFFHVSTAYVAGCTESTFRETDLAVGQAFRNDYEAGKFKAECMLREWFAHTPENLTVLRPSIIVGERHTARTLQVHHVYTFLSMLKAFSQRCPGHAFELEFNPDAPLNAIRIDAVADLVMDVLTLPRAWGRTYHLVDPQPLRNRELQEVLENALGLRLVNRKPDRHSHALNRAFIRRAGPYLPYLRQQPSFACTAAQTLPSWTPERYLTPAFITTILASQYMHQRGFEHGFC